MKNSLALLAFAALLGAATSAQAAIPVLSGGVGETSRASLETMQQNFTLKVIFTGEAGIFLSDVNVKILDAQGQPVATNVAQGPILLAGLPPGRYTLQASTNGYVKQQSVMIGKNGGLKTLYVRFPVKDHNGGDYLNQHI